MKRRTFLVALSIAMLISAGRVQSSNESIEVSQAQLEVLAEPGQETLLLLLSADIRLPLTETLKDAVNRGLALYFQTDVQLLQPRWYWWGQTVVSTSIEWRLSYHALTRQYRVATNAQGRAVGSLDEALAVMSSIRAVPVARVGSLVPEQRYEGWVRMRLDTGRLPKPFQMTAMTNRDWNPQSEWKRFDFIAPSRNDGQ